jgi:hypothetical protein
MRTLTANNFQHNQVKVNFIGEVNEEQLFEKAIETANAGYKLKAMEIAREALIYARQNNNYTAVYIHSFLAALCMDFMQFNQARIHIYSAQNRLSKAHYHYQTDKEYLDVLLKALEKAEDKHQHFAMKEIAA